MYLVPEELDNQLTNNIIDNLDHVEIIKKGTYCNTSLKIEVYIIDLNNLQYIARKEEDNSHHMFENHMKCLTIYCNYGDLDKVLNTLNKLRKEYKSDDECKCDIF